MKIHACVCIFLLAEGEKALSRFYRQETLRPNIKWWIWTDKDGERETLKVYDNLDVERLHIWIIPRRKKLNKCDEIAHRNYSPLSSLKGARRERFLFIMKNHLNFCYLDDGNRSIIFDSLTRLMINEFLVPLFSASSTLTQEKPSSPLRKKSFMFRIKVSDRKSYNAPCGCACHCMQTKTSKEFIV